MTGARARAVAPFLLFLIVVGVLHLAVRDPHRIYCEDIEHEFLPVMAYTYQHPWDAFGGRPSPSSNFGASNYLTHGGPAAALPMVTALLAKVAPRDPGDLALFEWRITSLHLWLSMAALFLFLRWIGADAALATAVACSAPFAFTMFREWRHADLTRGRLMLAPVLLGLLAATRFGGYGGWLLLAAAVVACMAQASQFYWVALLVAYWLIASAWLDRERLRALARREGVGSLRHAGPPLLALAVVGVVLGPMYLHVQTAMRGSALVFDLARDPERILYYFQDGRDWFSLGGLFTLESGLLPFTIAGLCLLAGATLWRGRAGGAGTPTDLALRSRRLALAALPVFLASLVLAFVPDLPWDLFAVRGGRLEWAFAPVAVPLAVAFLFHTTVRTWLVLAEVSGMVAGVAALTWWIRIPASSRRRGGQLACGLAVFAGLGALASWLSGEPWPAVPQAQALAAIGAVLAAVYAAASTGRARLLGQGALVVLGVAFAAHLAAIDYRTGEARCRGGEADAAAQLARDRDILARMPEEVRGLRQHRLFGEKWCYYLDASCALSYPLRTLPRDVLRFFEAAGAVDDARLPYWLHLDYAFLLRSGIAQMLGIRWWILPEDVKAMGGVLLSEGRGIGGRRLLEAKGAFAKGWALQSWETADSFERAVARVVTLGGTGALDRRGVVQRADEGPLDPSALSRQPPGDGGTGGPTPAVEILSVEPARIRFRVRGGAPTILATNEFFHEDWSAEVDGRPAPVWRVNAAFVGVAVPAGDHQVSIER